MSSILALCVYMKTHGALVKNDLKNAKLRSENPEEIFYYRYYTETVNDYQQKNCKNNNNNNNNNNNCHNPLELIG